MRVFKSVDRTSLWVLRAGVLLFVLYLAAANSPAAASSARTASTAQLWVDGAHGSDGNTGLAASSAFRTIQKAASTAGPGTTVHILPSVYRESVRPAQSGNSTSPILYTAEQGSGTVVVRGSEASSSFTWTPLATNTIGLPPGVDPTQVYYADLSAWGLSQAPRFVALLDANGNVASRLPLARSPNWQPTTDWKYTESWWTAIGGSSPAACDPVTNSNHDCDLPSRSLTQLTDPANLATLGNLTGATLVALDTVAGHYAYRRKIVSDNVGAGTITVDRISEFDSGSGNPGLGWGSKYYVENLPALLDTPGEWWYDAASHRLYLYPPTPGNPATMKIEISVRDFGFDLHDRSYTTLDGLTLELVNGNALDVHDDSASKAIGDTARNLTLRYANIGLNLYQTVLATAPVSNAIDSFTLQNSEVGYVDTHGIDMQYWWDGNADPNLFTRSGIRNTTILGNEIHHAGFRSDDDTGVGNVIYYADKLRFEGNHIHDIAHNGVQFSRSVIQSNKGYGFSPDEIKTGDILIKDNTIEKACEETTDCGALKIWGSPPQQHVYRNLLLTGNVFRNTFGWSYVAEQRGRYTGGTSSAVRGMGGFGLYVDMASGLYAYRNISYNNAYAAFEFSGVWRDGDMVFYNNVAANSMYGYQLAMPSFDTHGNVNTQILNNIIVGNEGFGLLATGANGTFANVTIDRNLYFNNGWRTSGGMWKPGDMVVSTSSPYTWAPYQTLADVQGYTPWDHASVEANPAFQSYDPADHNLFDGAWPDFHLLSSSPAVDRGTTDLPASLSALLNEWSIADQRRGSAFDIGRYELGWGLKAVPTIQVIRPGGTARYTLTLEGSGMPSSVSLSVTNPSSNLAIALSSPTITPGQTVTLTVSDISTRMSQNTGLYTIPIATTGSGNSTSTTVQLVIATNFLYLPQTAR